MSLRTKLIGLAALWVLLILIFVNIFIYFYIQKQTTMAENRLLWNKAQIILRDPEVHHPGNWTNKTLLMEHAAEDTLVRIIKPDGGVPLQYVSNERLGAYPVVYRTDYHWATINETGFRMLFVEVPILEHGKQVGPLELGKALDVVNFLMDVVGTGLSITTVGVVLFSLMMGYVYTKVMIRPLRQLVETMNTIRSKGSFVQLSPAITSKKDEFGKLGQTFNEMIVKLQENDYKQKHFVACASHELKTPLTVIESYTSLLQRWGSEDPAIRTEAIDAILSETQRLKSLIQSLLKLAEAEQAPERERETFDLLKLVRSTAKQLSLAAKREIKVYCGSAEIPISGYPEPMKQLLILLMDNAIKYSRKHVEVIVEREPNEILLFIKDYGIGIPEEDIPHLFERFYRVDPARNSGTGGSGLGLSIAKPIAELHGGSISITSQVGEGTTVTVHLPKPSAGRS
ncbi:HAMP domain-containing histidine kinase [Paenibacillus sp. P25]|nr:HAMP domain-containing histidine kinase [Paenibacillus sp. P25]